MHKFIQSIIAHHQEKFHAFDCFFITLSPFYHGNPAYRGNIECEAALRACKAELKHQFRAIFFDNILATSGYAHIIAFIPPGKTVRGIRGHLAARLGLNAVYAVHVQPLTSDGHPAPAPDCQPLTSDGHPAPAPDYRLALGVLDFTVRALQAYAALYDCAEELRGGRTVYHLTVSLPCPSGSGLADQLRVHPLVRAILLRYCPGATVIWVRGNSRTHCQWGFFHSHFIILAPALPKGDMDMLHAHLYRVTSGGYHLSGHDNMAQLLLYCAKHMPNRKQRERHGRWQWVGQFGVAAAIKKIYKKYFNASNVSYVLPSGVGPEKSRGSYGLNSGRDIANCRIVFIIIVSPVSPASAWSYLCSRGPPRCRGPCYLSSKSF